MDNHNLMIERAIFSRSNVGSAASVWQTKALLTQKITIDRATLLLVRTGQKVLRWNDKELRVNAGDILIIGSGNTFDVTNIPELSSGIFESSWISFCSELLQKAGPRPLQPILQSAAHKVSSLSPAFRQAFENTFDAMTDCESIPECVAVKRMEEILIWLDFYQIFFPQPKELGITNKVRLLITGNISWPWNMAETAKSMAVSEATLRRRLKAEGTSFSQLLSDIRMEYALTLLQVTNRKITHISLEVGYENPSKFAARFRKRFGFLPDQIRSENSRISNTSFQSIA